MKKTANNGIICLEGISMEKFQLKCTNGILLVYEDRVVISRKTAVGFMTQGLTGDKNFFYKDLSSVEYKKPSLWANGYIKFMTAGTKETNQNVGFLGSTRLEAAKDANSLILRAFNKEIPQKSEEIYNYIIKRIEECKVNHVNNNFSQADEILKFKRLLDDGIITKEEFDKKKQELLK